jgi:predicted nucleic acid-binding protein
VRAFVDTNILVRHLTGDPPELAARATRFLAEADQLLLTDLVLAEMVYVLESFYEVQPERVAELARSVVAFAAVLTVDDALLLRTIELYEVERLDFADAYLVASAEATGVGVVASFDQGIDRVPSIRRVEP